MFKFLSKLFSPKQPAPAVEVKVEDLVAVNVTPPEPTITPEPASVINTSWPFPTGDKPDQIKTEKKARVPKAKPSTKKPRKKK